ncbi:hypothetical protein RUM44_000250 [Polyplax serrata]|uniref:Uncharacterized protein n=1 Tax=Polyplax serrata TaxID=468196 RepID=A0ABR1B4W8_POLSC
MEFRNTEESKETGKRTEETKVEVDRPYFSEPEESDYKGVHTQIKEGTTAQKPSDVRNGDLVSLLLAATPPYLYNIPLVPQTFFFSEMLKSFVQAKAERQNLKAQQSHSRRQRKRSWREMTPPKTYDLRDKPLELTTAKQLDEKQKLGEQKPPNKKYSTEGVDKKYQTNKLGNSNFSVEKLANSSITGGSETINGGNGTAGDLVPPAPPPWYPLLYPPYAPYGIDPLHFFIDLRVSAHFWKRMLTEDLLDEYSASNRSKDRTDGSIGLSCSHKSAFNVPKCRDDTEVNTRNGTRKNFQNVHYIVSSLKDIYNSLGKKIEIEREGQIEKVVAGDDDEDDDDDDDDNNNNNNIKEKSSKDQNDLVDLEMTVDNFKEETDVSGGVSAVK